MKYIILFISLFISQLAQAVTLTQEEQEIICTNASETLVIEKKDKFVMIGDEKFKSVEFLDRAILVKSDAGEFALVHLAPKDQAVVIRGEKWDYTEKMCDQIKAFKRCNNGSHSIDWSPRYLTADGVQLPHKHYGVYPNDGTFHISYDNSHGIALVDFGSKFFVLNGPKSQLSCRYQ